MRDHAKRRRQALARALAITVTIGGTAPALAHDPAPALHATHFDLQRSSDVQVRYGFGAHLSERERRIGMYVGCHRPSAQGRAQMFFGRYPAHGSVQASVRTADGTVGWFGPVEVDHGSSHPGSHSLIVEERADLVQLVNAVFVEGATIGNGHRSLENRIPAADNRQAREALLECLRTKSAGS